MIKKKGIILSLIISLVCICIMPFSVSAQTTITTSNILGVSIIHQSAQTGGLTIMCQMDKNYVGKLNLKMNVTGTTGTSGTVSAIFSFYGSTGYATANVTVGWVQSISVNSINSQSLSAFNPNDWAVPYESINFVIETAGFGYQYVDILNLGNWIYPIFKLNSGDEVTHKYLDANPNSGNHTMTLIFWFNKNDLAWDSTFSIENGYIVSYQQLNVWAYNGTAGTRLAKYVIACNESLSGYNNVYVRARSSVLIMPIYAKRNNEIGFETQDFCDNFGLPYNGLDSQQQESVDNLEDQTTDFTDQASDLYDYENTFNRSMNDSLDDIDVNFNIGNQFGSKFMASATWVKTQFDYLTSGTPYGTVLSFSLLLGLALLLVGKLL